jgi:hypothetical protein
VEDPDLAMQIKPAHSPAAPSLEAMTTGNNKKKAILKWRSMYHPTGRQYLSEQRRVMCSRLLASADRPNVKQRPQIIIEKYFRIKFPPPGSNLSDAKPINDLGVSI